MRFTGLVLMALVAGCVTSNPPQAQAPGTPVAATSPAPATPVPPVSPSPTWTLGLGPTAVSTVDFSCRIPLYVDIGPAIPGAFIEFPSGTVTRDPSAGAVPAEQPGREVVAYTSVRYFDRAYGVWLPASRNEVSPDGSRYAYTDRATADAQDPSARATLHVFDVKARSEQTFDGGPWAHPYEVLDYTIDGIYLIRAFDRFGGLWRMDPTTGALARIAENINVQGVAGANAIWAGILNPDDLHPVAGFVPDELDRLSLPDGGRVPWLYTPGRAVYLLGHDVDGHLIVFVAGQNDPGELRLVFAPGVSQSIWVFGNQIPVPSNPISDQHGIWFGSADGLFLYTRVSGMQKVSNQPGYPGNGCF
ncbi:MAG TPA: hypothetical protein VFL27_08480 [Candidatus Dormibacteraeota bacterium]|nr:hypothetical protein [Candidatus Dormibacteraeota bacterium]